MQCGSKRRMVMAANFFFFKGAVGEDAVDELEVEGEAAAEHLGGADDVVHHDGGAR